MKDELRISSTISKCAFCERKIPIDISHVYGYEDFEEIPTQNVRGVLIK